MKKIEMFQCDHCGKKLLKTEKGMLAHEDVCYKNPENCYPCWGCKFRSWTDITYIYGGEETTAEVHYCTKKEIQIHNEVCEKKGLSEEYIFINSVKINSCKDYEVKSFFDE